MTEWVRSLAKRWASSRQLITRSTKYQACLFMIRVSCGWTVQVNDECKFTTTITTTTLFICRWCFDFVVAMRRSYFYWNSLTHGLVVSRPLRLFHVLVCSTCKSASWYRVKNREWIILCWSSCSGRIFLCYPILIMLYHFLPLFFLFREF